jgi:hypothetical protein
VLPSRRTDGALMPTMPRTVMVVLSVSPSREDCVERYTRRVLTAVAGSKGDLAGGITCVDNTVAVNKPDHFKSLKVFRC